MPDWGSYFPFSFFHFGQSAMQPLQSSRSTSRLASVPKKLWRSRAKSQSRLACSATAAQAAGLWIPEGNCRWKSCSGQRVTLFGVPLIHLSEMERQTLHQVALQRLKAMGITCEIPKEGSIQPEKTKRRPALLRRKAATTGFFDAKDKKDKDGSSESLVFGIPLSKCIQNDRSARLRLDNSLAASDLDLTNRRSESLNEPLDRQHNLKKEGGSSESLPLMCGGDGDRSSVSSIEERSALKSLLYGNGLQVPRVVSSCFNHIQTHGLSTLGIFRVSSSKKRVRQLREDFDSGQELSLGEEHHPHDVAQLLKEYFRDLPEPLLTRDLYHAFLTTLRLRPAQQLEAQKLLVSLLPVYNRDTLWALLGFLASVAQHAEDSKTQDGQKVSGNKMDTHNLATLFGPNLLRLSASSSGKEFLVEKLGRAEERSDVILVVRNLIENSSKMFQVNVEDQDAVYRRLQVEDPEALDAIMRWRFHQQIESTREAAEHHPRLEATRSVPTISITNEAHCVRPLTFEENAPSRSVPLAVSRSRKDESGSATDEQRAPQKRDRIRYSIKVHECKNKIEKSASSSAVLSKPRGSDSSEHRRPVVLTTSQNLTPILIGPSAAPRRKSKGTNAVSGVRFENERWKRWEIISSEYTEQGTLN